MADERTEQAEHSCTNCGYRLPMELSTSSRTAAPLNTQQRESILRMTFPGNPNQAG